MSLEVKVGPPQIAIHQGHAVLLTGTDGQMSGQSQKGYYFYDTRVISHWTCTQTENRGNCSTAARQPPSQRRFF
jgi:hypothetical protein